jgi:hypothetical protein
VRLAHRRPRGSKTHTRAKRAKHSAELVARVTSTRESLRDGAAARADM